MRVGGPALGDDAVFGLVEAGLGPFRRQSLDMKFRGVASLGKIQTNSYACRLMSLSELTSTSRQPHSILSVLRTNASAKFVTLIGPRTAEKILSLTIGNVARYPHQDRSPKV